MKENKTKPTNVTVDDFLGTVSDLRRAEAKVLIGIMKKISGLEPVMWGPSIIGFGSHHYKYDSGREGDMARIEFSPRKSAITIYFAEGFDRYSEQLTSLGKFKSSVSCLYINKLEDIDLNILEQMIVQSFRLGHEPQAKPTTVDEYIAQIPAAARPMFDELRTLVQSELPNACEVLSYGIIGYKIDKKMASVFISGWKDHLSIYPVPKDEALRTELKPYIKGKGTLWFTLDRPLPKTLIKKKIKALV
jgi:uncharacterized protein YdhG (YjbR/CyaY superfamily)